MTPPTTIIMSWRPSASSSARSAGTRVRCPAASELTPDDVHVGLDGLARDLGRASGTAGRRRRRSRGRRTPWRSPSGRGRGRPGPSWRRGCAGAGPAPARTARRAPGPRGPSRPPPPRRCTRPRSYGSGPVYRPKTSSMAADISPTVALARAASMASASRLRVERAVGTGAGGIRQPLQRRPGGVLVALGAQPLELGELAGRAPRRCRPAAPRSARPRRPGSG